MTLFGIKLQTWCFLFGAVILCAYTHYNALDLPPIIGSWLLMLGAFFGFVDEATPRRKPTTERVYLDLPQYADYADQGIEESNRTATIGPDSDYRCQ